MLVLKFLMFFVGGVPPSRWVVNFDFDLLDGLVLGALLGAHMPFLVSHGTETFIWSEPSLGFLSWPKSLVTFDVG